MVIYTVGSIRCMYVWRYVWMDGWMDGWMCGCGSGMVTDWIDHHAHVHYDVCVYVCMLDE